MACQTYQEQAGACYRPLKLLQADLQSSYVRLGMSACTGRSVLQPQQQHDRQEAPIGASVSAWCAKTIWSGFRSVMQCRDFHPHSTLNRLKRKHQSLLPDGSMHIALEQLLSLSRAEWVIRTYDIVCMHDQEHAAYFITSSPSWTKRAGNVPSQPWHCCLETADSGHALYTHLSTTAMPPCARPDMGCMCLEGHKQRSVMPLTMMHMHHGTMLHTLSARILDTAPMLPP